MSSSKMTKSHIYWNCFSWFTFNLHVKAH